MVKNREKHQTEIMLLGKIMYNTKHCSGRLTVTENGQEATIKIGSKTWFLI